jgi:hypothetical protein
MEVFLEPGLLVTPVIETQFVVVQVRGDFLPPAAGAIPRGSSRRTIFV